MPTGFTYDVPVGDSIYNALQTHLMRRFRGGISMNARYTFSKSIDDASSFGGVGATVAQNWLDLAAERGLSSFNRTNVFTHELGLHIAIRQPEFAFCFERMGRASAAELVAQRRHHGGERDTVDGSRAGERERSWRRPTAWAASARMPRAAR